LLNHGSVPRPRRQNKTLRASCLLGPAVALSQDIAAGPASYLASLSSLVVPIQIDFKNFDVLQISGSLS
jgi:hypothetical protein